MQRTFFVSYVADHMPGVDGGFGNAAIVSDARHITPDVITAWQEQIREANDFEAVTILFFTKIQSEAQSCPEPAP